MSLVHSSGTVAELQQNALTRWSDREVLVGEGRRVTAREMRLQTYAAARLLKARGLVRGDGIAMLAGNRIDVVVLQFAAQLLGLRYTALHPMGSEADHRFILEDSGVKAIAVDLLRFEERGRALLEAHPGLVPIHLGNGEGDFLAEALTLSSEALPIEALSEDIAFLSYTGGTTGRPKGAIHRHRSIVNLIVQELAHWEWPEEVRFLAATPLSHAAGAMLTPTLTRGGAFHFLQSFDPETFLRTVEQERITAAFLVPTMLYVLLDYPKLRDFDLSSLEMIIYGAAPMSPVRLQQAISIFGPVFCQLYGQTEAPNTITYLSKADHQISGRLGSCGVPLAGNIVRIMRSDGEEAAVGEAGEICVRGPIVMDGYWNRPEENQAVFLNEWLKTGDVARADADGYLYIVDRAKDMIISGGFNLYPREIEDVLVEHEAVGQAAVIGIPDEKWGEAVRAVVVARPGAKQDGDALIAYVRERKGSLYAPKSVEFVDALPLTAVGKLDRKRLREVYWSAQDRKVG